VSGERSLPDAVTFEIIRHKLHQVLDEAILALENVSGSPTTAEGHDMMVSLYRADGSLMVGGVGFLHHLSSAAQAVRNVIRLFLEDPGIEAGDVYMLNDSYTAALHPPDVYLISPIFHGSSLHGFVANFVHVTDIGAVDPGGFSPNSRSRFHEGFQTQGLKIVERGRARRDVMDTILNQVREPDMVALDLRSQMAANHVAVERMQRLYEEYGPDTVDAVSDELIQQSERLMRERLLELSDGVWRMRQYVDGPDRLHRVELAMTKRGDRLGFDFTGTDPQSRFGINNSYWATWGAVLAPLYPLLAWDITWNEGMLRPIDLVAPAGTLVHAIRPAPVSVATVSMIKVANNMSNLVLGKLLDASPGYRERASAVWDGVHTSMHIVGRQHGGEGSLVSITDSFAGSGGAQPLKDGVDLGGELANGVSRWANAETHELHNPVLYLYRRLVEDSGGPGRRRGGLGHEFALVPHDGDGDSIELVLTSKGNGVPMSIGLSGGYPGCNTGAALFRGSNPEQAPDCLAATGGAREDIQWGEYEIRSGDVFYLRFPGGGGYGDPLAREPESVAADVAGRKTGEAAAREVYGVVLDARGEVDGAATRALRLAIRGERIGGSVDGRSLERGQVIDTGMPLNEYIQACDAGVQCTWCGHLLCERGERWKEAAARRELPPSAGGMFRDSLDGLVLRQFACMGCGTLLETEVACAGDPLIHDEVDGWSGASAGRPDRRAPVLQRSGDA
jgi:N-methylhydantoinase B